MDEPTSGLDSSISYDVLKAIKKLVKSSNGELSVLLSIHQPNHRILELFDHLLLLEHGAMIFFGTIPQSLSYFASHNFNCPTSVTPTDYFLLISDSNFTFSNEFVDFPKLFQSSVLSHELTENIKDLKASTIIRDEVSGNISIIEVPEPEPVPFLRQLWTLVKRDFVLAYRDPTLYYLQFVMTLSMSLLIGCIFYNLPFIVDSDFEAIVSGLVWIVILSSLVHIFKVYHISKRDALARHEIINGKYTAYCYFWADTITTSLMVLVFNSITPISYFMMGFPAAGYPFFVLQFWLVILIVAVVVVNVGDLRR